MPKSKNKNYTLENKTFTGDTDTIDTAPNSCRVSYIDIGVLVYSIIFHFVDSGFDIFLAYSYFITEQYSYFAWTTAFIAVPTAIMSAISIRMYIEDSNGSWKSWKTLLRPSLCVLGSVLQVATAIRYFDSILYAIKCLKAESRGNKKLQEFYYKKMLKEDSDAALLRVFECYIESTCQQVLQLTLLLIDYSQGSQVHMVKQCIMITLSFVSMGWCMATYHKCIRFDRDDKPNISTLGTLAQFWWHMNLTVSRIFAVASIAILYPFWTCIAVAGHWCAMTVWIAVTTKTNFCGKSLILEILFSSTVGLIYIFNFLSLKDGPTRKSYSIFFSVCGIENVIASVIWGLKAQSLIKNWTYYVFLALPIGPFLLSIVFLIIYYALLHPSKSIGRNHKKIFYGSNLSNTPNDQELKFGEHQFMNDESQSKIDE